MRDKITFAFLKACNMNALRFLKHATWSHCILKTGQEGVERAVVEVQEGVEGAVVEVQKGVEGAVEEGQEGAEGAVVED